MSKRSTSREAQLFDSVVGAFGKLLAMLLSGAKRSKSKAPITHAQIAGKWQIIDELVKLGGPSRLKQAVVEADKLLSQVLGSLGFEGSVADKLKAAREHFSAAGYEAAWQAHKLRNQLVHETGEILDFALQRAIKQFKQAINELIR